MEYKHYSLHISNERKILSTFKDPNSFQEKANGFVPHTYVPFIEYQNA